MKQTAFGNQMEKAFVDSTITSLKCLNYNYLSEFAEKGNDIYEHNVEGKLQFFCSCPSLCFSKETR